MHTALDRSSFTATLMTALVLAACGSDATEPNARKPAPLVTAFVSPREVTVELGRSATITVRTNMGSGSATLSVANLPAGVAAQFSPSTVPGGTATSELVLTATESAPSGSAMLTISVSYAPEGTTGLTHVRTVDATVTVPSKWMQRASMPVSMNRPGAAVVDGIVYVAGGAAAGEILEYDPAANTWQVAGTLLRAVNDPAIVALDNKIYIIGGDVGPYQLVADVQIFDVASRTVTSAPPLSFARTGAAAVVLNGRIHVIGGSYLSDFPPFDEATTSHDVYDPADGSWSTRASFTGYRVGHDAAVVDGKIYLTGGYSEGLEIYEPTTDSWRSVAATARVGVTLASTAGRLYVIGGSAWPVTCCAGPMPTSDVRRFDPSANNWHLVQPAPHTLNGHAAAVVGGDIYVFGGTTTMRLRP